MSKILSLFKGFNGIKSQNNEKKCNDGLSFLLGWNKKGNHFLSIVRSNFDTLNIWDVWNNRSVRSILMKGHDLITAAYNDKLDQVVLLKKDRTISFYDIQYDIKLIETLDFKMEITGLKFTPDGENLLLVSEHNLYIYSLINKTCSFLFHNFGPIAPDLIMPTQDGIYFIDGKDLITIKYGHAPKRESIFPDDIKYCCIDAKENLIFFVYSGSPSCLYLYDLKNNSINYLAKSTKAITGMTMHPDLPIIGMNYDLKRSSSGIFSFHYLELIGPTKAVA
jgi:hypothetical protein